MTPNTEWWLVDAETGALSRGRGKLETALAKTKPVPLRERSLESLIALNPELVGAAGHLPLLLHGGQTSADQVYCDTLGRNIVVEVKAGRAKKKDVIQLLGYAHHLHFEQPFTDTDDEHLGIDVVAVTRPRLRELAESAAEQDKDDSRAAVVEKIDAKLPKGVTVESLGARARKRLGLTATGRSPVPGVTSDACLPMAPRLVLAAPAFDDDCIELTDALNDRWLDVSLVAIRMFAGARETIVTREVVRELASITVLRRAVGRLWKDDIVSKRYVPDGWYFSSKRDVATFSFSGRRPSEATFWLEADSKGTLKLETRVPHSTFAKTHADRFGAALDRELPRGAVKKRGDWTWTHSDGDEERCLARALEVAKVSDAILGADALRRTGIVNP